MKKAIFNIFVTLLFIVLAHHLMVLIHSIAHNILAWIFGFTEFPFNLSIKDFMLFFVDHQTNYNIIFQKGHNFLAAIIAITPNVLNAFLFFLCVFLITSKKIQEKIYLYYFLFWFMIMNIGQIYSYIMWRFFETQSDLYIFLKGTKASAYWLFIPGILFTIYGIYIILKYLIPKSYKVLKISALWVQAIFLFVILVVLFTYFGGLIYNIIHQKYNYLVYPILTTILFYLICFPKNRWVQNRLKNL